MTLCLSDSDAPPLFFFLIICLPPRFTLFPYTTLFRSLGMMLMAGGEDLMMIFLGLELMSVAVYVRSEEHTSELQSLRHLVCRLLLEKKKIQTGVAPRTPAQRA